MASLMFVKAVSCWCSHLSRCCFARSRCGRLSDERLGIYRARKFIIHSTVWSYSSVNGGLISFSTLTFHGSRWMPFSDIMCPKYGMLLRPNTHFSGLNLTAFSRTWISALRTLASCSSMVFPDKMMSSTMIENPLIPSNVSSMHLWNSSCAEIRPNGIRLNLY